MDLVQPITDLFAVAGLYAALRRENRRTRSYVFAIAKFLGVRLEDGIHVHERTPARGQQIVTPANGDTMRRIIPLFLLGLLLGAGLGAASCSVTRADAGQVLDKGLGGAAAGAASGGPIGAVVGGVIGLLSGVAGVVGGKVHSRGAVIAAQATADALQAANAELATHRDQLGEHNAKLSQQLDTAHQLVRLALDVDGPLPATSPAPSSSAPPPAAAAAA